MPALVIVWSADEPGRGGEVALLDESSRERVLGRGGEGGARRVSFFRQRPGSLVEQPALTAQGISREQLVLRWTPRGLQVVRRGLPGMRVNGFLTEDAVVEPGDTIEVDRKLLLLYTERAHDMPTLRHGRVEMPFGERDEDGILGESPAAWQLRDELAYARAAVGHVLIMGESGTGKELAARAVHARGRRATKPFVSHNAATFPSGLIDAELFGNARNYPNAGMPERAGLVGEADGGVLFLDEIGELPPELHARLLRVLDAGGEYRRLGEANARRSDFRLVAATNRDPAILKHDLLSRLRVRVTIPSLRDRREDVPLLARAIVLEAAALSSETAGRFVRSISGRPEANTTAALMDGLVRYPYSTNTREIAVMLSAAMAQAKGDVLGTPKDMQVPAVRRAPAGDPSPALKNERTADEVRAALDRESGNVSRAAAALGVSRQGLYRLLEKYGLKAK